MFHLCETCFIDSCHKYIYIFFFTWMLHLKVFLGSSQLLPILFCTISSTSFRLDGEHLWTLIYCHKHRFSIGFRSILWPTKEKVFYPNLKLELSCWRVNFHLSVQYPTDTSLIDALLAWSVSSGWRPCLGRFVVGPYHFHFQIIDWNRALWNV